MIDVDAAKGGDQTLLDLDMLYEIPPTLTTRTPTGGRHLFYRLPAGHPGVPNTVGALGPGIDTRSTNGYVVGPGSVRPIGPYRFEADAAIADAPQWLLDKLGQTAAKAPAAPVADGTQSDYERAKAWLRTAERSVKGKGGDQVAYKVACHLRDLGMSFAQACELMRSDAWDNGCGWREGYLEAKPIASAYKYAQNEPGRESVTAIAAQFEGVPAVQETPVSTEREQSGRRIVRMAEFTANIKKGPGYLIKGVLQRDSYAEIYGEPGAGKTFVALDMAYHVAAGMEWMGCNVHAGPVLYLAYEGTGGLGKRLQALQKKHGSKDVPLYLANASYNLRELSGRKELGADMAAMDKPPVLIVIDTFARALMGGDENSAQDTGAFNSAVQGLIEATGACVLIIHHSGKNKAAGARGSSAIKGALDTELEIDQHQVFARKQRDIEMIEPIPFKLTAVTVGMDEDGDVITSCYVEPTAAPAVAHAGQPIIGNNKAGLEVLVKLAPDNKPVKMDDWSARCRTEFLGPGGRKRFYDLKKRLLDLHMIEEHADGTITRKLE